MNSVMDGSTLEFAVRAIGWALFHSLWQGALIAAITALLLRTLEARSARARYLTAGVGLAFVVVAWGVTAASVGRAPAPPTAGDVRASITPLALTPPDGAGDFAFGPAIRPLSPDALRDDRDEDAWRTRLDAWAPVVVPLWLAGVVLLSLRLIAGWFAVERLRHAPSQAIPARVIATLARLTAHLDIRRPVRVVASAMVQVPTVIGWLRPVVLLPVSALAGLAPAQLDAILAHELAHIRRHDYAINALQSIADVLLFYHPACWWLSSRIRIEREHCCDDVAVSSSGDRLTYARALADLEALRVETRLALAATDGPLLQRVRRLVTPPIPSRPPLGLAMAAPAVLAVVLGITVVQVVAKTAGDAAGAQSAAPSPARIVPGNLGGLQGQVTDGRTGAPIGGTTVEVVGPAQSAYPRTDADGRYEAVDLEPGAYTVSVSERGYVLGHYGDDTATAMDNGARVDVRPGRVTAGIDIRLAEAASISGRILDDQGRPIPRVEVELMRDGTAATAGRPRAIGFAQSGADGSYRIRDVRPGDYVVRAYEGSDVPSLELGRALTYGSTFYPSATDMADAQRLHLYPGQELFDIEVVVRPSPKFRVTGTVSDASGPLPEGLRVAMHGMSPNRVADGLSAAVDAAGRFELVGVVPGDYMILVNDPRRTPRWVSTMRLLTVDGDLTDLEIRAMPGAQVEGRVVADSRSTSPLDVSGVQVGFIRHLDEQRGGFVGGGVSPVSADGRFALESPGGAVSVEVNGIPSGWTIKSIGLDGQDVGDGPLDFGGGRRELEIVLTDKLTTIAGVVVDRAGRTRPNYSVIIFPDDPTLWHRSSRFILAARSNNAGRFTIDAVPPGRYLAVAVPALPMNVWMDPDVLARLQTIAEPLRLTEGQQLTISIRASAAPEGLGARLELAAPGAPFVTGRFVLRVSAVAPARGTGQIGQPGV